MQLTKHFSYKEVTKSATAIKFGINNDPDENQLQNIKDLLKYILEPVRVHVGAPVFLASCFRSDLLNKKIGGAHGSQHMANKGAAADIDIENNSKVFNFIKLNCDFDQLIWEFGNDEEPDWVHVSFNLKGNRYQVLKAVRIDGKTKYIQI